MRTAFSTRGRGGRLVGAGPAMRRDGDDRHRQQRRHDHHAEAVAAVGAGDRQHARTGWCSRRTCCASASPPTSRPRAASSTSITIGSYEAPIWGKQELAGAARRSRRRLRLRRPDPDRWSTACPTTASSTPCRSMPRARSRSTARTCSTQAGLTMPEQPTYDQIAEFAAKLTDKSKEQYGICLRGKPGWGENMAFVGPMVNAFGGRWFDEEWKPQLTSRALEDRGHLLRRDHERLRPARRHRQRPQREPGAVRDRPLRDVGRRHLGRRLHLQPEREPGRRQDRLRRGAGRRSPATARAGSGPGRSASRRPRARSTPPSPS